MSHANAVPFEQLKQALPPKPQASPGVDAMAIDLLADSLGVSADALDELGVTRNGIAWHIPERDASGNVIGIAKRFDTGGKGFVAGGHRGLTMPWPMPEHAGTSEADPILIVEGMTDCAAGNDMGLFTIGRPSATGGGKLLAQLMIDRHVVIVGENDSTAGKLGAEKIGAELAPVAASVRIIYPPDGAKDLREWVNAPAGCDIPEILSIAESVPALPKRQAEQQASSAIPRRRFIVKQGKDIETCGIDYLWERRIPMASLTVAFSRPGRGKSTIAAAITAHVTTGREFSDGSPCPLGDVVYVKGEGSDTAMKQRMDGHRADASRYVMVSRTDDDEAAMIDLALDGKLLEEVITPATKLVIIDTLDSLFPSMRMIDNANIRKCLWPLQEIAERTGVAVLVLAHTNKGAYADPLDRLSGGRAIGAAARAIWYMGKVDPKGDDCHMASVKCNDFLPADTIGYSIEGVGPDTPGHIVWGGTSELSAWDLDGPPKNEDQANKGELCESWLADLLAGGPKPAADVQKQATEQGYGRRVMAAAKRSLDVQTIAQPGSRPPVWYWCLLGQCPPTS